MNLEPHIEEAHRVNGNIYMNPINFGQLVDHYHTTSLDHPPFWAVNIFVDKVVPLDMFFVCTATQFDVYKYLREHCKYEHEEAVKVASQFNLKIEEPKVEWPELSVEVRIEYGTSIYR